MNRFRRVCGDRYRVRSTEGTRQRYGAAHACALGHPHSIHADVVEAATREYLASLRFTDRVVSDVGKAAARGLLATVTGDPEADAERLRLALKRLVDLYTDGEVDRDTYRARKAELEARLPKPIDAVPVLAVPAVGDAILACSDAVLRDLAQLVLERVVVNAPGIAFEIKADVELAP